MYLYIYIYIYVYVYICIYTHIHTQNNVHRCAKATTPSHIWNEGFPFSIADGIESLSLQVTLIQKGLTSTKSVGFPFFAGF